MKRIQTVKGTNSLTAYFSVQGVTDDQTGAAWITAALQLSIFVPRAVRLAWAEGEQGSPSNIVEEFRPNELYGDKLALEMRVLPVDTIFVPGSYLGDPLVLGFRCRNSSVFISVPANTQITPAKMNDLLRELDQIRI